MHQTRYCSTWTLPCVVAAAVLCLLLSACAQQQIAAKFESHTITEQQINEYTEQYRAENGLVDDEQWKEYLTTSALTAQTWRERAVRKLADELLIRDKASELSITADEEDVAATLAKQKEQAGIAADDTKAWAEYLSGKGLNGQLLEERAEFSSIEQQVFKAELDFTTELENEMCDDYIKTNLADQVVRRYYAIAFAPEEKDAAESCLASLASLEGEQLVEQFSALAASKSSDSRVDSLSGDIGWDFIYSEKSIDPKLKLRNAKLTAGKLYGKVLKGEDAYRVVMCAERVEFVGGNMHYANLESESLKQIVRDLTMASSWTAKCMQYLNDLEKNADIKVSQMPQGLPYDVS